MVVIIMGNINIFKALSSETRLQILKLLLKKDLHITGLAREIGISVPVMSRHITVLERAGLIKKRIIGNVHLLSVNLSVFEQVWNDFCEYSEIDINKDESLFDALKQLPDIKFNQYKDKQFISSIHGEQGYYVYEVDGKPPNMAIDEFVPTKDVSLSLKKIVPVDKKNIKINIRPKDQSTD